MHVFVSDDEVYETPCPVSTCICFSLQDVVQVSSASYAACTLQDMPVKKWSPLRADGTVVVTGLQSGRTYYWISTAFGRCQAGSKLKASLCMG